MKTISITKSLALLAFLGTSILLQSQTPDAINYQAEELESDEILKEIPELSSFIENFIQDFCSTAIDLSKYVHPEIEFGTTSNPGVYCLLKFQDSPEQIDVISYDTANISPDLPAGDFCEGYKNAQDGFYYSILDANKLPDYSFINTESHDFDYHQFPIPSKYHGSRILEIIQIHDQIHYQYLYLIELNLKWYIIIQDYCDCSA